MPVKTPEGIGRRGPTDVTQRARVQDCANLVRTESTPNRVDEEPYNSTLISPRAWRVNACYTLFSVKATPHSPGGRPFRAPRYADITRQEASALPGPTRASTSPPSPIHRVVGHGPPTAPRMVRAWRNRGARAAESDDAKTFRYPERSCREHVARSMFPSRRAARRPQLGAQSKTLRAVQTCECAGRVGFTRSDHGERSIQIGRTLLAGEHCLSGWHFNRSSLPLPGARLTSRLPLYPECIPHAQVQLGLRPAI
ncbi:hypothetical protein C8Q79DRAFT_416598 [Trametes meyenii]|nr:hypothetical protein C8Q79DRAFT_416598 [Trametes meyenii]